MKSISRIVALIATVCLLAACTTNSITGRSQFIMFSAEKDAALGLSALNEFRKNSPIIETGLQAERVRRIGRRIAAVSDRPNFDWEFILVDQQVLNAWALPGGKIAVYAKMAASLSDEELAAVLGHEIAHAILRHGAESLSRAQLQQLVLAGVSVVVATQVDDPETGALVGLLAGLAAQGFVSLPHSRSMELEADDIGTLYMARAGYNPRAAVSLWQKMARLKGGQGQPLFLSTHPSDSRRIDRITAKMTVYLDVYKGYSGRDPYTRPDAGEDDDDDDDDEEKRWRGVG